MSAPWTQERPDGVAGWPDGGLAPGDDRGAAYPPDGLVTLRYLWDAGRRHARLWLVTGLLGLVAGFVFPFVLPPPAVATTKLLVAHRSGDDPAQAIATDVRLATTDTVARRVVEELGLREPPNELLKRYTVEAPTNRIVVISAKAPSEKQAVRLASTVATTFLEFRMEQVRAQQKPAERELAELQEQASKLQRRVEENGGLTEDPPTSKAAVQLEQVNRELEQATLRVQEQQAAAAVMSSSRTLDPAVVEDRSALRTVLLDTATGLGAGLVVGVGFIIVRALVSDRLWRRQTIADALGVRIALSVGQLPGRPWRRLLRPDAGWRAVGVVVDELRDHVHWTTSNTPTLAVVAVDDLRASALLVATLARSYAAEGKRVLVADLSRERTLARRFDVADPGVVTVEAAATPVTVYVPDAGGPAEGGLHPEPDAHGPLLEAWDGVDLVLTFTDLHPAQGGEHLRTWASHAVAVVTAGRSSAARLHATGELLRIAGVRCDAAVLLGQDATDETVGAAAPAGVGVVG